MRMKAMKELAPTILFIAAIVTVPAAAQESDPFQSVAPIVLLLTDSSGSMEYDWEGYALETEDQDVLAVPECPDAGGKFGKSRFIVAAEVLTGSFTGYSCLIENRGRIPDCIPNPGGGGCCDPQTYEPSAEDYCYPVPHIIPQGPEQPDGTTLPLQLENGLIDVTGSRFKFGLMTFDAVSNGGAGPGGGYSYGSESGVNYGARNETAPNGPFVKPTASDDEADILANNQAVEAAFLSTIPYGGTPIAPMLHDALEYFTNDPDLQPYNASAGAGDMFYNCRSRNIILISDGRSNLGEGSDGYLTSTQYAQQLFQAGVNVYVIGFQLPDGVESQMDSIAQAGSNGENEQAFIATDLSELAAVLSQILGGMESTKQSRSRVVVTNDTGNTDDLQYQFDAAYGYVDGVPGVRQGFLERTVFSCVSGNQASVTHIQPIEDQLNNTPDGQRTILAVVGSQMTSFLDSNSILTTDEFAIPAPEDPGQVDLVDFSPTPEGVCGTGILGDASIAAKREQFKENLIKFVRATDDSCRTGHKMGAIIHSTPAIQGHLKDIDVMIPSFQSYKARASFIDRPTMLYVGTHDGLLHGIRISRPNGSTQSGWGQELWAVIPNHLLKKLKDLPLNHSPLLDGEPVVKDVLLTRTLASIGATEDEADNWRSILVTGYGEGGQGYIALDVTDPVNPQFLWEISNEGRCQAGDITCPNSGGYANDFSRLGYTLSRPAIGNVYLGNEEVAVAVFGGGSGVGLSGNAGKSVFVVRLDTGEKLEEFHAAATSPGNVAATCTGCAAGVEPAADMIGAVSCFSSFPGTFITRCYLGDRAGRLWRVELGSQSTGNWKLQFFYDPYASLNPTDPPDLTAALRAPVLSAPGISIKPFKNELVVVYGAGDTEAIEEFEKKTFIASLTETLVTEDVVPPDPNCTPFSEQLWPATGNTAILNWKMFFGHDAGLNAVLYSDANVGEVLKGEKLMGSPVVFSSVAYFVTFAPDVGNACNPGVGWVWGVDYFQHGATCMEPVPKLDYDGNETTEDPVMKIRIGGPSGSSIPYGLTVARRPSCFDGSSANDSQSPAGCPSCSTLAEMGKAGPEIIVHTSTQSTASSNTIPAGANTAPTVAKMTRSVLNVIQSLFVGAWGFIFD